MRISDGIMAVLEGRVSLDQADPSIQSCIRLPIYTKACEILALPTVEERRNVLKEAPPLIRPYLEEEIMRIWDLRRSS